MNKLFLIIIACLSFGALAHIAPSTKNKKQKIHRGIAQNMIYEKLPDGTIVYFQKISNPTPSKKEITAIKSSIDSKINKLTIKSKNQPPRAVINSLHLLKQYLNNLYKTDQLRYRIANTSLSIDIITLRNILEEIPNVSHFKLKNCQYYVSNLSINVESTKNIETIRDQNTLPGWPEKALDIVYNICKNNL